MWFKKEKVIPNAQPPKFKYTYILIIKLKGGKEHKYYMDDNYFPHSFRKILNWHLARKSEVYHFNYDNGILAIDRNNIEFIKVNKENYNFIKIYNI